MTKEAEGRRKPAARQCAARGGGVGLWGPTSHRVGFGAQPRLKMDQATIDAHGLSADEYQRLLEILGREPTITELGIFSVMWSEHCSYKSSRLHLRRLPTEGSRVVQGPGENAGAVDIGDGLTAVFKIESHNHPSFIEPYQGAATGVGGSFATSSRWARVRSRCSTPCGSVRWPTRPHDGSSTVSSPASPAMATASASRPSAARLPSSRATRATRW